MTDLKIPLLIHLKGGLFLLILIVASALLIFQLPHWRTVGLVALVIWGSARFYYYLFYVIEKYVDPDYKFSGVFSAVQYLLRSRDDKLDEPGGKPRQSNRSRQ